RYFLLSSHYRSPLNYTEENFLNAQKGLVRLYQSIKDEALDSTITLDAHWVEQFNQAMNDDFNTPVALSVLFQLSHEINKNNNSKVLATTLKHLAGIMGFLQEDPAYFLQ